MDQELEHRINGALKELKEKYANEEVDYMQMDPVAKMLLVALLNETQKINNEIDSLPRRIEERFCADFIPRKDVEAIPAITVLQPKFRIGKDFNTVTIGQGAVFTFTYQEKGKLNYIPLFNTLALPYSKLSLLSKNKFVFGEETYTICMDHNHGNLLWLGINTKAELNTLRGLPLLIKGAKGIHPRHIYVGSDNKELDFVGMDKMENALIASPFDSQQASGQLFSFMETWKDSLLNLEDSTIVIITDNTDPEKGRDLFKPQLFPREFQQWLENDYLDKFQEKSLWLRIEFPEGYNVSDHCQVIPNAFPVINVDVCNLTLSQASPIAKLQKQEGSYFLQILEPSISAQDQGFPKTTDEVVIRDFDASCYQNGDLYRDVRNLFNRFIDDYYAFTEYNNIKDGEILKKLRDSFSKLNKDFKKENIKNKFESGVYVMRNLTYPNPSSITKVSYITTQGKIGNSPKAGDEMENKKLPALEKNIPVLVSAACGSDRASIDKRFELLRYYTLTNDRLFTRMDVDAFVRKEISFHFNNEESKRITIETSIQGMGGEMAVRRGLYIDIIFKDLKNYDKAVSLALDKMMYQKIMNKSCISMPIMISLINSEK